MLNRLISVPISFMLLFAITGNNAAAQCTNATVNWDQLDYLWNSGGSAPYVNYVNNTREQTQRFAIGPSVVTIATSNSGLIAPPSGTTSAENTTNTAEAGSYGSGADVQYIGNGTITLTFATAVTNLQFSLYDIDRAQRIQFGALNGATAIPITLSKIGGTILSFTNNGTTTARVDATNTTVSNSNTDGTVNVDIAGPVTSVTITSSNTSTCSSSCGGGGTEDGSFWLSDITACVPGSFPTNWHQQFGTRPFVGPTQNQPDYFLVTPDNKSVYMMDPASGRCWWLFSETSSAPYVNSFGYDPSTKYLYYVTDGSGSPANNKAVKRYDFNTETISTIISDVSASPFNISTYDQGVESAGAAFYNGTLYFGIEGGRSGSGSGTVTRETIIYGIEFNGSNSPIGAYQVWATDAYKNGSDSTYNDWGDFIIKDGTIYNFNTARAGSSTVRYKYSSYHHYNMQTGNLDAYYQNPNQNNTYTGQAGMGWSGNLYFVRDSVGRYFEDGTNAPSANRFRSVVQSVPGESAPPAWVGGAGDASDPFRPKCDFGDAPDSYDPYVDPSTQSPAVHERSELIRLGSTWDREFWKRGVAGNNDTDDGIAWVPFMPPGAGGYLVQVSAFNNSGSPARLIAWLDYNGNGTFDASEAITPITVPSSASAQNFWLFWPSVANSFVNGQSTYMRVRITSASAGMTTSHATGYFTNGEVEDYRVLVDNFPLATHMLNFNATLHDRKVLLDWSVTEEAGLYGYEIERSKDNLNWKKIGYRTASGTSGTRTYEFVDDQPFVGVSYYRIRITEATGMNRFSAIRQITVKSLEESIVVSPNPVDRTTTVKIESSAPRETTIAVVGAQGNTILTFKHKLSVGSNQVPLNLPETLAPGTYFIMVTIDDEVVKKKFIKAK